jgi:hypothetical protein
MIVDNDSINEKKVSQKRRKGSTKQINDDEDFVPEAENNKQKKTPSKVKTTKNDKNPLSEMGKKVQIKMPARNKEKKSKY